jgi:hypothetical protein
MTAEAFRAMALSLPGTVEGRHQGHADFRVRGKVFATLGYPDDNWAMVRLTPEEQKKRVRQTPAMFVPAKGQWGEQGSTLVNLEHATETVVQAAMQGAWNRLALEASMGKARVKSRNA